MIELIFIGIAVCFIIYFLYIWYNLKAKKKKEFTTQVYQYLKRRYVKTEIDDYGGGSSNPQILSHEAGPFKQISVTTETQRSARENQDIIIGGEVDALKYQKGNSPTSNLSVYPRLYHSRISKGIQINDPTFDTRFLVFSSDSSFAYSLLSKTNLGTLIKRSYDLKAYEINWRGSIPIINIKMDTMNVNSFIRAFSILLGSVGTLTELGHLIRKTGKERETLHTFKIPKIEKYKTPSSETVTQSVITSPTQVTTSQLSNRTNLELKTIPSITSASIPLAPTIKQKYSKNEELENDILSLFNSIKYQVQDILVEESSIKILPFSADENQTTVTFPKENLVLFSTTSKRLPIIQFELFITHQTDQERDWGNPWKNITIEGTSELVEKIRSRTNIANHMSIDQIEISSKGNPTEGIDLTVSVKKSYEGIRIGYRIIKDFLWFLETELTL